MKKKEKTIELLWKVGSLSGGKVEGNAIPIDGGKFRNVRKSLTEKGYRCVGIANGEKQYRHFSIRGLFFYVNDGERTLRTEGYSASALSQIVDDFGLPAYKQG